jgi:hypothetical protein
MHQQSMKATCASRIVYLKLNDLSESYLDALKVPFGREQCTVADNRFRECEK